MKLNGHELEMTYVNDITNIKKLKINPIFQLHILVWKANLKKRLKRLEKSFTDGFLDKEAYQIWKQMITEVI